MVERNPFFRPSRAAIDFVERADRKLTRAAMKLMQRRTGAPAPVHPKNLVQLASDQGFWFEPYFPAGDCRVLDLGGGSGALSLWAARRGARVTVLERDARNLVLIRGKETIEVIEHDLERAPYPVETGAYDVVVSHDVIEHLHHRREHVLEAGRALKPGGRLVMAAPNRMTTWKWIRGSLGLSTFSDDDHKVEYSREELLRELEPAGFRKVLFEAPIVIDLPINGLIDLLGPLSLGAYRRAGKLKEWLARRYPRESTGFRMVLEREPSRPS